MGKRVVMETYVLVWGVNNICHKGMDIIKFYWRKTNEF